MVSGSLLLCLINQFVVYFWFYFLFSQLFYLFHWCRAAAQVDSDLIDGASGLLEGFPGLSEGHPGLSEGHPGLSEGHPGLLEGPLGLYEDSPGLSEGPTGLSEGPPGLSEGPPSISEGFEGPGDIGGWNFSPITELRPPPEPLPKKLMRGMERHPS